MKLRFFYCSRLARGVDKTAAKHAMLLAFRKHLTSGLPASPFLHSICFTSKCCRERERKWSTSFPNYV